MLFTYGPGKFVETHKEFAGEVVLSEHKVYLRNDGEDLPQTYVPLEKIESIRQKGQQVFFFVRTSIHFTMEPCFIVSKDKVDELIRDIVSYRGFKKSFWQKKWVAE